MLLLDCRNARGNVYICSLAGGWQTGQWMLRAMCVCVHGAPVNVLVGYAWSCGCLGAWMSLCPSLHRSLMVFVCLCLLSGWWAEVDFRFHQIQILYLCLYDSFFDPLLYVSEVSFQARSALLLHSLAQAGQVWPMVTATPFSWLSLFILVLWCIKFDTRHINIPKGEKMNIS